MEQVSGITGAGPLLQRVVLRTAARYRAGLLPTPAEAGARPVRVCAVSGGLAGKECPGIPEWVPAAARLDSCTWHESGATVLPEIYAEWAVDAMGATGAMGTPSRTHVLTSSRAVHIISPMDGDRYSVPAGTDPRYATIALRAVTREPAARVRWFVDGVPVGAARWPLRPGEHTVRALAGDGASDEVRIVVE
jgi:membrane carboxypeptidase/penicillin-binding protein PbpC